MLIPLATRPTISAISQNICLKDGQFSSPHQTSVGERGRQELKSNTVDGGEAEAERAFERYTARGDLAPGRCNRWRMPGKLSGVRLLVYRSGAPCASSTAGPCFPVQPHAEEARY